MECGTDRRPRTEAGAARAVPKAGEGRHVNHLEQLVAEWLQFNGYYVRVSVQVGPRPKGGFEGELDVVGIRL